MGGMWFDPESLGDGLSETAGYKSGLALSIEEICSHLAESKYADIVRASEKEVVRLRSEEYEDLFYLLLYRIGYTKEKFNGELFFASLYHKYKKTDYLPVYEGISQLFNKFIPSLINHAQASGTKKIDPAPYLKAARHKYGKKGLEMAHEYIAGFDNVIRLSPFSAPRYHEWDNIQDLESLFVGGSSQVASGGYIDQRFINYLLANDHRIGEIHWRKFEELIAEYFDRSGYRVELGPGTNDDGVDIRIWKKVPESSEQSPLIIVQCKRQKAKVEKIVIKGLYADVQHCGADMGLIVTTSELSVGARETIRARAYPIEEVNKTGLKNWLTTLEKPGTGIVRL